MDTLNFGKELIRIRKSKGLTQAEVAEKCNITIRTIQRIESGVVKPRSSTVKMISEFLEVDFFENSNLKNRTILWHLKDIFNLKTNTMKKISILSTFVLILTLMGFNIFRTEAQSKPTNKKQKVALESQNEKVDFSKIFDEFKIADNYVFVTKNNKQGLMTIDGKVIVPCEYDMFEIEDNYVLTLKGNKRGLMNLDGETIIPCEYNTFEIEDNYVLTLKGNKRGLMNLDGETIIPCEYDTMKFDQGVAIVTKNGKTKKIRI
ncbi:WG repeat-containing protein [Gelatiniphilus marinus]|uniref:WG repeat-containing protein n=1 Tax=Gelatiniphilus marinus TaxID=1759464 RepID=A0ABW5JYN2_9FLAO